jgi:3-phenylpropionate/trans-cinnamate dioxygenase ferredoxin reductase subunit
MRTDVLLIGGGVAGASAAAELRAQGFAGSVTLVTRELDAPYHRPPVTKALLTGSCSREDLLVRPEGWWEEHGIDLRTRTSVTAIDTDARTAVLATKDQIEFDHALVATGAMVRRLSVDGAHLEGLHYLRAPGNAEALRREVETAERVVIVGGSFIATEVAASLATLGKRCTIIMQEELPLERAFGRLAGAFVEGLFTAHDVEILRDEDVLAFEGDERVVAVRTASGGRLEADVVVIGAGAVPDVMLARRSGLALGDTGGIRCDVRLLTSAERIYAAGDACEYESVVHRRRVRIEHEDHAIAQGVTAARNILGADAAHDVVPYFWSDLADWTRLECVGAATTWDEEVASGDTAGGAFTVWYVADGRVVGALTVGRPEDLATARTLIAEQASAKRLSEVGVETTAARAARS